MASFGNVVAPIPVNPLMTYAQIQGQANAAQAGQLQNQGLQQTLTDQATLRSLAPQLASGDPNALSQAATLGANGVNAVTAVDAANTSRRTNLGAYAGMVGKFRGFGGGASCGSAGTGLRGRTPEPDGGRCAGYHAAGQPSRHSGFAGAAQLDDPRPPIRSR